MAHSTSGSTPLSNGESQVSDSTNLASAPMGEIKIVVVLVTFNRLTLLKEALNALERQTRPVDHIVVVNNASTDGTQEWLAESVGASPKFTIIHCRNNLGGAGGFKLGLQTAMGLSADWIWVMDDDCISTPDALKQLMSSNFFRADTGFLASNVRWTDGSPCMMNVPSVAHDWSAPISANTSEIKLKTSSFVSLLVNSKAVNKVGLPVAEFFIWYDDVEYTSRISREFSGYLVPSSIAIHKMPVNAGSNFADLTQANAWKYCFGFRNETAVISRGRRFGILRALVYWARRLEEMQAGKVAWSLRFKVLFWGLKGLLFDYHSRIEFLEPLNSKAS